MPDLALYDHPISSNALKVRVLLAELGLEYERRTVPLARPRSGSYLEVNPLGGIPTLQDGDLLLSESQAILRYLARREERDDLYPSALRERALVDEFLDRFATRFRPALFRHERLALGYAYEVGFDGVPRDPEGARRVADEIAPELELLDRIVAPEGAVLGRFTIADCALTPVLHRTTMSDLSLDAHPRLAALRERLLAHPAVIAAEPVL